MSILGGEEIKRQMDLGNIVISPCDYKNCNPNSWDLHLYPELQLFIGELDMKKENKPDRIHEIPEEGYVLQPGILYLGRTLEYTATTTLVPMLEGRSSVGRLGMAIHVTAGFGDIGFRGYWTLEIVVTRPLRVYPNVRIGQIYYHTVEGDYQPYGAKGTSKYQDNSAIQTSQMYKDFLK